MTNLSKDKSISADRGRGRSQASRGRMYPSSQQRGQNPFDPYSIDKAPMFIFENQVTPINVHNLSKTFVPNLITNRVYLWVQNLPPQKWPLDGQTFLKILRISKGN